MKVFVDLFRHRPMFFPTVRQQIFERSVFRSSQTTGLSNGRQRNVEWSVFRSSQTHNGRRQGKDRLDRRVHGGPVARHKHDPVMRHGQTNLTLDTFEEQFLSVSSFEVNEHAYPMVRSSQSH